MWVTGCRCLIRVSWSCRVERARERASEREREPLHARPGELSYYESTLCILKVHCPLWRFGASERAVTPRLGIA